MSSSFLVSSSTRSTGFIISLRVRRISCAKPLRLVSANLLSYSPSGFPEIKTSWLITLARFGSLTILDCSLQSSRASCGTLPPFKSTVLLASTTRSCLFSIPSSGVRLPGGSTPSLSRGRGPIASVFRPPVSSFGRSSMRASVARALCLWSLIGRVSPGGPCWCVTTGATGPRSWIGFSACQAGRARCTLGAPPKPRFLVVVSPIVTCLCWRSTFPVSDNACRFLADVFLHGDWCLESSGFDSHDPEIAFLSAELHARAAQSRASSTFSSYAGP
jgi:hypothetical protein